jgi:hypothetical protein
MEADPVGDVWPEYAWIRAVFAHEVGVVDPKTSGSSAARRVREARAASSDDMVLSEPVPGGLSPECV